MDWETRAHELRQLRSSLAQLRQERDATRARVVSAEAALASQKQEWGHADDIWLEAMGGQHAVTGQAGKASSSSTSSTSTLSVVVESASGSADWDLAECDDAVKLQSRGIELQVMLEHLRARCVRTDKRLVTARRERRARAKELAALQRHVQCLPNSEKRTAENARAEVHDLRRLWVAVEAEAAAEARAAALVAQGLRSREQELADASEALEEALVRRQASAQRWEVRFKRERGRLARLRAEKDELMGVLRNADMPRLIKLCFWSNDADKDGLMNGEDAKLALEEAGVQVDSSRWEAIVAGAKLIDVDMLVEFYELLMRAPEPVPGDVEENGSMATTSATTATGGEVEQEKEKEDVDEEDEGATAEAATKVQSIWRGRQSRGGGSSGGDGAQEQQEQQPPQDEAAETTQEEDAAGDEARREERDPAAATAAAAADAETEEAEAAPVTAEKQQVTFSEEPAEQEKNGEEEDGAEAQKGDDEDAAELDEQQEEEEEESGLEESYIGRSFSGDLTDDESEDEGESFGW